MRPAQDNETMAKMMHTMTDKSVSSFDNTGTCEMGEGSLQSPRPTLRTWAQRLAFESQGIQRVTDEQREQHPTKWWNACTFWLSANMAVATLATGMLGGSMGLAFWDCFAIIVVVNMLSCLVPAYTASFGLTGLRMTTFSRFSFGYWGNILVVIFSMVSTTGWNAINSISGASVLYALSDGVFPEWAGVIVICTTVWIICTFGLSWIHHLDSFFWILPLIVWCVAAGTGAQHFHGEGIRSPTGANGAAAALSFIAVIFSFAVSWVNCASDYNVKMSLKTSKSRIFWATYVGICVPAILVQTLGAAMYSGTERNHAWKLAYSHAGVGGLLKLSLEPAGGFGKFLLVIAALSAIPNNIPNNYSFGLHLQNWPGAVRIPRAVLVTFGYIAAIIVSCFAAKYFHDTLQTFLSVIGYWTVIHIVVVLEEHFIFRKSNMRNYDLDAWNDPSVLPFGWAAIAAFMFGFAGAALGMKTTWYKAPIAALIGSKGANIGHELSFAFSAFAFPVFRVLEKKYTGK